MLQGARPSALLRRLANDEVVQRAAQRTGGAASAARGGAAVTSGPGGVVDGAVAPPAPTALSAPPKELAELRTAVNKAGVNVNQLARLGNAAKGFLVAVVHAEGSVETRAASEDQIIESLWAFIEMRDVLERVEELLGGVRRAQ